MVKARVDTLAAHSDRWRRDWRVQIALLLLFMVLAVYSMPIDVTRLLSYSVLRLIAFLCVIAIAALIVSREAIEIGRSLQNPPWRKWAFVTLAPLFYVAPTYFTTNPFSIRGVDIIVIALIIRIAIAAFSRPERMAPENGE